MKYTEINYKDSQFFIEGKPVINHYKMLRIMHEQFPKDIFSESITYSICKLNWVPDGDYIFVSAHGDNARKSEFGMCQCGVPNDVHGTCCGWNNAVATCDESLTIRDSRHPFYRRTINEWINSRFTIKITI